MTDLNPNVDVVGPSGRPARVVEETTQDDVVRQYLRVPMRDGVELASLIFYPADVEPRPALIMRTPYGARGGLTPLDELGFTTAKAGYAILIQDVRGSHDSDGIFALAENDRADAWDTIEWLIAQPWSNGAVGLTGTSALGMTTWLAAANHHPAVKAIFAGSTGRVFDGFGYYGRGIVQPDVLLGWAANQILPDQLKRTGRAVSDPALLELTNPGSADLVAELMSFSDGDDDRRMEVFVAMANAMAAQATAFIDLAGRPAETAALLGEHLPWLTRWAAHDDPSDPFWTLVDYEDATRTLDVPGLHTIGWHDLFIRGALRNFVTARKNSSAPQRIVISPFTHMGSAAPVGEWVPPLAGVHDTLAIGEMSYSPEVDLTTRWFDRYLKGESNGVESEAPISIYIQRANIWRDEWEWPLARTNWTNLYLTSEAPANSVRGGGRLVDSPSTDVVPDTFQYDPADPVPSAGGTFLGIVSTPGIVDQAEVESRGDVLVFTSAPFVDGVEVTGPVAVELFASTSAVDTDFTAKMTDVSTDGSSTNVCDGVTRLRFREDQPGLVEPGSVQRLTIELSPTSYFFQPGHSIRLQVSSSNFPLFLPNNNMGANSFNDSTIPVVATQQVFHDLAHPSRLIIPVIPHS